MGRRNQIPKKTLFLRSLCTMFGPIVSNTNYSRVKIVKDATFAVMESCLFCWNIWNARTLLEVVLRWRCCVTFILNITNWHHKI